MTESAITASTPARQEPAPRRSIPYQPALDGVRALAVLVVLLFHAQVTGFSGGYLGVSVFFTLSGYLITTLLVGETRQSGTVALGAFYARRARRLLPASIACIAGIVVISGVTNWFDAVSTLRRDIIGSLLQVANWVFLLGGGSYQELFDQAAGTTSPLEHYWSLAIEEQFYWLWPIAFVWLTRVTVTPWARRRAILLLTALAAIAAPVIAVVWGPDAAYWSTPARAAEILVGALLAVVITGRSLSPALGQLAPVALAGLAILVVTFPAVGGPAYSGALPLVAIVSGALLLGLQFDSPVRRALSIPPLVWIGTISYGVYLYHWPIFVILDEERTGMDGVALTALRFVITFALAQVSFMLLERPIRRSRSLGLRPTLVGAGVATAALIVATVIVVPIAAGDYWSVSDDAADAVALEVADEPLNALVAAPVSDDVTAAQQAETPPLEIPPTEPLPLAPTTTTDPDAGDVETGAAPPPIPVLERPVRIVIAGDSTAEATGVGVVGWAAENPARAQVELFAVPGCGFMTGGAYVFGGEELEVSAGCTEYVDSNIPGKVVETQADVVMLLTTSWDVQDRAWDDGVAGSTVDAEVAERLRADLIRLTESILAAGDASVAWVREPIPDVEWGDDTGPQEDPARHAVIYAVMDELAMLHPARVHVIDLPAFLDEQGLTRDREARPDGVHWTPEVATFIATRYLGEQLIRSALDLEPW
jgi:peptidoglycan/LPS O-acetylase OafA/YrhL